jgi:hypothetical protein
MNFGLAGPCSKLASLHLQMDLNIQYHIQMGPDTFEPIEFHNGFSRTGDPVNASLTPTVVLAADNCFFLLV